MGFEIMQHIEISVLSSMAGSCSYFGTPGCSCTSSLNSLTFKVHISTAFSKSKLGAIIFLIRGFYMTYSYLTFTLLAILIASL